MASLPRITPKSQPPQLKAAAQHAERQGKAPRAMELLEAVLRQVPDDWPTVQRLADLRARPGSGGPTERALEAFTELYGEAAGYRDVAVRVERLRSDRGQSGDARNVTRGE